MVNLILAENARWSIKTPGFIGIKSKIMARKKLHKNGMDTISHRCPKELSDEWKLIDTALKNKQLRAAIKKIIAENNNL
jgi:hypothetical protein